jgi:hypothetical protein
MRRPGQACDAQLTVFRTGRHFDADLVANVPHTCLEANEVIEWRYGRGGLANGGGERNDALALLDAASAKRVHCT